MKISLLTEIIVIGLFTMIFLYIYMFLDLPFPFPTIAVVFAIGLAFLTFYLVQLRARALGKQTAAGLS